MEGGIYSAEQLAQMTISNAKDIAELKAEIASAHKRIDENDRLTNGIHQLAENVAAMSVQIKMLTEKFDRSIERIEKGLDEHGKRIDVIEKAPSKKWDKFVWLLIGAAVSAVAGVITGVLF